MLQRMLTTSLVAATLLASGSAAAYTLNAHKAICVDVLKSLKRNRNAGAPFKPAARYLSLAQKYQSSFLAGCGYPDASPFMGDTDPSHSNGWDPVGQAGVLWNLARSPQEKAFVLGWYSHLAMDGSVHAFANTYSGFSVNGMNAPKPLVWNTFVPKNFIAHLVAESWVGKNFVYTRQGEVTPPRAFVKKMFLHPGSPIVRHYQKVLKNRDAIKRQSHGHAEVGALATLFQKLLDHLNTMNDYHWKEYYTWTGHQNHYKGRKSLEGRFKHWFAGWLADWHKRRTDKIENVKDGWIDTSMQIAKMLFASGPSIGGLRDGFKPFVDAMKSYVSLDLQLIKWPTWMKAMATAAKEAIAAITAPIKELVVNVLKEVFEKQIAQAKEIVHALTTAGMRKVFSKDAEAHATKYFASVGLKADPQNGGVDNAASRDKLHKYGFYRNAFLAVMSVLETPKNLQGLPSADYTNGFTCTKAFKAHRKAFLVKGDRMYDSTPETCNQPAVTRLRGGAARFDESAMDYKGRYGRLTTSSKGYSFRSMAKAAIAAVGKLVKQKARWAYNKVKGAVKKAYRNLRKKAVQAYRKALSVVKKKYAQVKNTVRNGIKKVKGYAKKGLDTAKKYIGKAKGYVKKGLDTAKKYIGNARKYVNRGISAVKNGYNKVRTGIGSFLQKGRSIVNQARSRLASAHNKARSTYKSAKSTVSRYAGKAKKAYKSVKSTVSNKLGKASSSLKSGWKRVKSLF